MVANKQLWLWVFIIICWYKLLKYCISINLFIYKLSQL
jgi:hypothetical protein